MYIRTDEMDETCDTHLKNENKRWRYSHDIPMQAQRRGGRIAQTIRNPAIEGGG